MICKFQHVEMTGEEWILWCEVSQSSCTLMIFVLLLQMTSCRGIGVQMDKSNFISAFIYDDVLVKKKVITGVL